MRVVAPFRCLHCGGPSVNEICSTDCFENAEEASVMVPIPINKRTTHEGTVAACDVLTAKGESGRE